MNCPHCGSTEVSKNGKQRGKQNHLCKACRRQFIETYDPPTGYSEEVKRECLKMYVNGMGFRHSAETFRPLWAIVATWQC